MQRLTVPTLRPKYEGIPPGADDTLVFPCVQFPRNWQAHRHIEYMFKGGIRSIWCFDVRDSSLYRVSLSGILETSWFSDMTNFVRTSLIDEIPTSIFTLGSSETANMPKFRCTGTFIWMYSNYSAKKRKCLFFRTLFGWLTLYYISSCESIVDNVLLSLHMAEWIYWFSQWHEIATCLLTENDRVMLLVELAHRHEACTWYVVRLAPAF